MQQHEAPDLWSAFAMAVFAVNGLLIQAGESISRPLGQSSARWQVLGRVYRPQTVAAIAQTGVDIISVGALTHSARALDISLELRPK